MPARPLDLISHWQIAAPPSQVFAALADPAQWPQWWPALRPAPQPGAAAAPRGIRPQRLAWSAGGPFQGLIDLQTLEALAPERLRLRSGRAPVAAGPAALQGECIWLLRAEAGLTQVTHVWRLDPVMRAGAAGLAQHLQAQARR